MNFESFPSEIFFEIFDFLDNIHIIHGFHNLNYRFNNLLLTYFRVSPQLNLQSITKSDFHMACKGFLPLITDKIHSLCLSNDDHTPQQIDLFFYSFSLYKFPHLQSLSLHNIHSEQMLNRVMLEWHYPIHLTHLNLINCQVLNDWNIVYSVINNIWSLPKLTHCQLDINVIDENYSIVPTVISTTLECLSIKNLSCNGEELVNLFEHTPRLRYLDITVNEENINHPHLSFSVPLLTKLKLMYEGPFSVLKNLLENVPNLRHWTMKTKDIYVEGQQWEEIISNHLSKLEVFRLLMIYNSQDGPTFKNRLIGTYKSDFWLKKHNWYVQGHSYHQKSDQTLFLYTLPYTFHDYHIPFNQTYSRSKSNLSYFNDQISYERVHHLFCQSVPTYQFRNQFPHLHHLALKLPFNDNLWTSIPTFDQLRTLDVSLSYTEAYNKNAFFQLQTLLERAPQLHSLTVQSSIDSLLPLLECTSQSIVKLDFQNCNEYFNSSNCATLFLSPLGKQCKILSINVDDRMNILQLVKEIPQLQALNIQHPPDKYKTDFSSPSHDQLIRYLRSHLPSTCTITRDSTQLNKIQIWIR